MKYSRPSAWFLTFGNNNFASSGNILDIPNSDINVIAWSNKGGAEKINLAVAL